MKSKTILYLFLILFLVFNVGNLKAQDVIFIGDDGLQVTESQSEDNFSQPGDNTYFGNVLVENKFKRTFTVQNVSNGFIPLIIYNPIIINDDEGNFTITSLGSNILFSGQETTFEISFSPKSFGIKDAIISLSVLLQSENTFNVRGIGVSSNFEIYEKKGGALISNNNQIDESTDFGIVSLSESKQKTYVIQNSGNETLDIDIDQENTFIPDDFIIDYNSVSFPISLDPNDQIEFEVNYEPKDEIEDFLSLGFITNDLANPVFLMNLLGNGTTAIASKEIMISQYYENGREDYLEVTNVSDQVISGGTYHLCEYNKNRDLARNPNNSVEIPQLLPGEVFLYDGFNIAGNEIFLISTVSSNDSYKNRVEVIGEQLVNWGDDLSLSKGSAFTEKAHLYFDKSDWVTLSLEEVDNAQNSQNKKLGYHSLEDLIWDGGLWTGNSIPDRTRNIIINEDFNDSSSSIETYNLTVNENISYNSGFANSMVVYGDLIINGTFTLGDKETLVMYNDNANIEGDITKIEKSNPYYTKHNYTYWSSSVKKQDLNSAFVGVKSNRIFKTDASSINPYYSALPLYEHWWIASGEMEVGRGYAIEGPGTITYPGGIHEVQFTGMPNNGNVSIQVIHNTGDSAEGENDLNLIGNPYPSAINADAMIAANGDVFDQTLHIWNHSEGPDEDGFYTDDDYILYNLSGSNSSEIPDDFAIASGQGFMIQATKTGNFVFNNGMRVIGNNEAFFKINHAKKDEVEMVHGNKNRIWLKLTDENKNEREILLGFFKNATDSIDKSYDAKLYSNNFFKFYSLVNNQKLAIQSVGVDHENQVFKIGFNHHTKTKYSLKISKIEGEIHNANIILVDKKLGTSQNLIADNYFFESLGEGEINNRFEIHFKDIEIKSAINEEIQENSIKLIQNENSITLSSLNNIEEVYVYDILGNLYHQSKPDSEVIQIIESKIKKGSIFIVKVKLDSQIELSKKYIRK